jgi:hypothetical protein
LTSEVLEAGINRFQQLPELVSGSGRLCLNPPAAERVEAAVEERRIENLPNLRSLPQLN